MNQSLLALFEEHSYYDDQIGDYQEDFEQSFFNQGQHLPTNVTKAVTINIKQEDINYKNFPKMIGNNIVKWIKKTKYNKRYESIPKGFKRLIEFRQKDKQSKIKIKDLRDSIKDDSESKELFQEYIADQLFLDLMFSNKVADPFPYIPGICNYYSAAQEPEKMVSNYIMRKEFVNQKVEI
ncbi:unnamed protein product (macronuclear) [Paramecium tetraurelia]|uniref:Uncharacterized protein n=1 Tax=Paramecium tetraurelia TaxID=5888 RepID=A0EEJ7_PARTE|nr:uncharacterized protein GSPATT00026060001 [Paramecium tetraurelia]CAK93729.1 unnamed protein product [Paramecium tetraurelia]|eukprot:XP_001461111.1 hypothetical protein (macronuclear) [Paramecium tetraurelia strain d4-2]